MSRKAGSKEFRDKIEERKGTDWYDSAKKVGDLHDPHMSKEDPEVARYSGAEIRAEMRHGRGDMTTEELTKKYEDMYASGEINLNGNAKEFLREKHGAVLERMKGGGDKPKDDTQPIDTSDPVTEPKPEPKPQPINITFPEEPEDGRGDNISQIIANNRTGDISGLNNNSGTINLDNSMTNTNYAGNNNLGQDFLDKTFRKGGFMEKYGGFRNKFGV